MKSIISTVVVIFTMIGSAYAQKQPQGVTYDAQILKVTDGDTVVISAPSVQLDIIQAAL